MNEKKDKLRLRVLHCPHVVGGHSTGLARAERLLGAVSLSIAFTPTAFGHTADEHLWKSGMSRWSKIFSRWKLLLRAFLYYDVIHYNFGSSILEWYVPPKNSQKKITHVLRSAYMKFCYIVENQLLKNKIIAITYQGDDARQGDYTFQSFKYSIASEVSSDYYCPDSDKKKRAEIKTFDKIADLIYTLNPDLAYVLPNRAQFVPYAHIDLNQWNVVTHTRSKKPMVLHAPSHAGAKGTRFILAAVTKLQEEGINFDFVLVENMPNKEARRLYEQCDLVVDQLLAGWYGGFAVEAMALGKPVICYIREEDTQFISAEMKESLPFIQATPDTICEVLREWITLRVDELHPRGITSRAFVEQWHDPIKIAQSVIKDYERHIKLKKGG